jgi:transglutaminase-like putative cysteine protease
MLSLVPGSVPHSIGELPDDSVAATRETLGHMVRLARQYKKDIGIVTLARQLIEGAPGRANQKNYADFIRILQNFVRDKIRYVQDIKNIETIQTPTRTLEIRTGDCDDKSLLLAALLESIGIPARFLALGYNGENYSHVIVEARLGQRWLPLECIADDRGPGWFPESAAKRVTRWMPAHV